MSDGGGCWSCRSRVDETDRYCRHCGNGQGLFLQWYYRPVWIMVLTVTALGPFSLFLVWRTPLLGPTGKWIASIVIVFLTAYLSLEVWRIARDLLSLLGGGPGWH